MKVVFWASRFLFISCAFFLSVYAHTAVAVIETEGVAIIKPDGYPSDLDKHKALHQAFTDAVRKALNFSVADKTLLEKYLQELESLSFEETHEKLIVSYKKLSEPIRKGYYKIHIRAAINLNHFGIDSPTMPIHSVTQKQEIQQTPAKISDIPSLPVDGTRVALVIGNSRYPSYPLKNPVNDARDIGNALRSCGFYVIEKFDCDLEAMESAIRDFGERLRGSTVALFFFAGHGSESGGVNYLWPIDANPQEENEVKFKCLDAGFCLAKMEDAKTQLNVIILDACRNNPFSRSWHRSSGSQGLAKMDAPVGSIIVYATAPGSIADDGVSENGLFTEQLLKHLGTPGLPVEQVFKLTMVGVQGVSGKKQVPWMSSSFGGDFFFRP